MKGETKEKAEGGRMSRRSRSNVCTVSQRHWGTEAKTIIYKRTRKQNGEAEGAQEECIEQGSESRGLAAVLLRKRNVWCSTTGAHEKRRFVTGSTSSLVVRK